MNYNNIIKKKLFTDEPEVDFVEIEDTDTVYEIGEFLELIIGGYITDYDGFGKFVDEIDDIKHAIDNISFSVDEDSVYYKSEYICSILRFCKNFSIYEVVWFNK